MWAETIFYNFFLVPVRKIISVQEIYSDTLIEDWTALNLPIVYSGTIIQRGLCETQFLGLSENAALYCSERLLSGWTTKSVGEPPETLSKGPLFFLKGKINEK